ncbi:hypothetical protein [Hyalangium sp.]|uniref:hypothetical protein n=1 Tax=Hyalangium sp. TaxID=2028555 RepID=UPI002D70CDC6|nr:hypothetical protein [Hyalangium sp.]HYH94441.1 hypothetical protein [Hyalangium sp.]
MVHKARRGWTRSRPRRTQRELSGDRDADGIGDACDSTCPGEVQGPTLILHGSSEMTLECGVDTWTDPGADAWDMACTPLEVHRYNSGSDAYGPGPDTSAEGTYSVQYIAWNAAGTTVSAIRSGRVLRQPGAHRAEDGRGERVGRGLVHGDL